MENAGFYLLRSKDRASEFVRVLPSLIVGAGTTSERNTYTYTDTTAEPNVPYYYRLDEVSLASNPRQIATVRVREYVSTYGKRIGRWADIKTEDE